ncbi:Excisionase/Xis, DNA-binding domain protein [Candidatus Magnetoovum chiemensis]|nr:Excisionase/Xis, DNA-binding domain protein [Candidatus Magnetoovum chiemensis]
MDKRYLTGAEVAKMLGISVITLRKIRNTGKIKSFRFSENYKYEKSDVDEFIRKSANG